MTASRETTLQVILRLAPRDYRESRDPKNRFRMFCPVCNYVPRGGGYTSFSIHEDQNQWSCFACGNNGGRREMLGHLQGSQPLTVPPLPVSTPSSVNKFSRLQGATVRALCYAKGLDEDWCRSTLGWRDGLWYKTPAVEMPYYIELGVEGPIRYRVGIDAGDRFRARGKQALYGLWDLPRIRQMGWVILEEGETDFATLFYHQFPVIGVPGSAMWRREHAQLLQGLRVYLWREPDQGGDTLFSKVTSTVSDVLVINPPAGVKDPNELYLQEGANFRANLEELINQATPYKSPPGSSLLPIAGIAYTDKAWRNRKGHLHLPPIEVQV